ncbi:MAG: moderate conductance mechanosensitive channel [Chloroflexota bacterium]|jgi:small conductance mechanosensitive channel|nr:moderate conductance mechanosensitive channel [Chloroflexota bacterium]
MDLNAFLASFDQRELIRIVLSLVVILVLTWLCLRLAQGVVNRAVAGFAKPELGEDTRARLTAAEEAKRRRTLETLGGNLARLGVLVLGGLAVLGVLSVDLGPVIAGLGLLGLGIGLGLQNLVRDIVAGAFILIENQYATGDLVRIADATGTVEELGLRRTVLRDADGTVHVVPNGLIAVASNQTRAWGRILVDVPIREPADLERAQAAAQVAADTMRAEGSWRPRFLDAPQVQGVQSMTGSGVLLQASAMVVAADRRATAAELRRRIVAAFAEEKIPFGDLPPGWTVPR